MRFTLAQVAYMTYFWGQCFAADCLPLDDSLPVFDVADAQQLQQDIMNNNFNPQISFPIEVKAGHEQPFILGTALACVSNAFLFDNTHDSQSDIAFAIQNIIDQCNNPTNSPNGFKG
jgi:hypothetical protein